MYDYDLFISYSSHDRPWAEKLYGDLTSSFRSIRVFWDREAIPAGAKWRTFLKDANVNTIHLAIFWSDEARNSNEVGPEIEAFEADVRYAPNHGTKRRCEFFIPLEGKRGGGIQDIQGFPDFAQYYDPTLADRGVSKLDVEPGLSQWKRMIRKIGDAISEADSRQKVIAAIVAMNTSLLDLLDMLHSKQQTLTGPTLDQFLAQFGLTWGQVRTRYFATAQDWHPFGGKETIVDLLEDLRVKANSRLDLKYRFRWHHIDLTEVMAFAANVQQLLQEPSVVIVDPISLYNPIVGTVFRNLADYARNEQSIILSLAPLGQSGADLLACALRELSVPILNDYFEPRIPPLSRFAMCCINVQRMDEIERFVRSRLALLHMREKEAEARTIIGVGH